MNLTKMDKNIHLDDYAEVCFCSLASISEAPCDGVLAWISHANLYSVLNFHHSEGEFLF